MSEMIKNNQATFATGIKAQGQMSIAIIIFFFFLDSRVLDVKRN